MGSSSDDEDLQASKYGENWMNIWGVLGSFEDTTRIPAMRFTDTHPLPLSAVPRATVQVFSAEISGISGGRDFGDKWGLAVSSQRVRCGCRKITANTVAAAENTVAAAEEITANTVAAAKGMTSSAAKGMTAKPSQQSMVQSRSWFVCMTLA
ncbi:hypothetical protein EJB05_11633, partial [Eragrostis curvula]